MQRLAALRKIEYVVIHCHAGNQNNTAEQAQGFARGRLGNNGYHVFVEKTARNPKTINSGVIRLVSDDVITWGVKPFRDKQLGLISNKNSIQICWLGGLLMDIYGNVIRNTRGNFIATDNRTDYQKIMLAEIATYYSKTFKNIKFLGHNQISPDIKSCPNFSVPTFCEEIGIPKHQIYYPDNFGVVSKLPQILRNLR